MLKTRCVGTTRMSPSWILRMLANVSPFFNSLSNRLRITNYCLRSLSSSLLKFTRFIQANNTGWSGIYNTCMWIRSPIPIKHYLLIDIEFFSELKVSCGLSEKKVVTTKYLAKFQSPMAVSWPKIIRLERILKLICNLWLYILIPKIKSISPSRAKKSGDN